jgi:hypothetical protein
MYQSNSATPQVLLPWNPAEAITTDKAAAIARKSQRTIRIWASNHDIGRRIVGGDWVVSHVALLMLLEDDREALSAYLRGDRESHAVTRYFERAQIEIVK